MNESKLGPFLPLLNDRLEPLGGRCIFAKVWGSWSHNTQLPESDVDYLAVYQLPTQAILSLVDWPDTLDGKGPDFQAHEIGKFCRLLLKGNPGIVECLFTERERLWTPEWQELCELREIFLNRQTLKSYLGYCDGQLHRLLAGTRLHSKGGGYNTKWAYHLIRLALDAERIAQGQPPVIFKEGEERETLMAIRRGDYSPDQIERMFRDVEARIRLLRPEERLPERADASMLDIWLWRRRQEYMEGRLDG